MWPDGVSNPGPLPLVECIAFIGWKSGKATGNRMCGCVTCDFTSFSTIFQSYQDDGRMIRKGCMQWIPIYG